LLRNNSIPEQLPHDLAVVTLAFALTTDLAMLVHAQEVMRIDRVSKEPICGSRRADQDAGCWYVAEVAELERWRFVQNGLGSRSD
jgi:hypothetical protein